MLYVTIWMDPEWINLSQIRQKGKYFNLYVGPEKQNRNKLTDIETDGYQRWGTVRAVK